MSGIENSTGKDGFQDGSPLQSEAWFPLISKGEVACTAPVTLEALVAYAVDVTVPSHSILKFKDRATKHMSCAL